MIICNSRKFIFVHLYKCAGTSVTVTLAPILTWQDIVCGSTRYGAKLNPLFREQFDLHKHSPAARIREVVGEAIWNEYFTFTFVRNPYDRIISLYTYLDRQVRRRGLRRYIRRFIGEGKRELWSWPATRAYLETRSFGQFIRHDSMQKAASMRSQRSSLLADDTGRIMLDYVGRVEHIDHDFAQVTERIGCPSLALEEHNVSDRSGNRDQFYGSQQDYDYVYEMFRDDFDAFGYERCPPTGTTEAEAPLANV